MTYAQNTTVSIDKTQSEIQSTLRRYKASAFMFGEEVDRGIIAFVIDNRKIKMVLPLPVKIEDRHKWASGKPWVGRQRTSAQAAAALDQERKARWRGLLLCIKAKLEAVDAGIETFDQAFLAYLALPNGNTVGEEVIPRVEQAAFDGLMPTQMLAIEGAR